MSQAESQKNPGNTTDERPLVSELMTEPSIAIIESQFEEYRVGVGNFVRLGSLLLTVPLIPDPNPKRDREYRHIDLVWAARRTGDAKLQERVSTLGENSRRELLVREEGQVVDAGIYTGIFSPEGSLGKLAISGQCYDFGRPSLVVRAITVELFQETLGPSVEVVSR